MGLRNKPDKSRRFAVIHEEGTFSMDMKILQDTLTGVQYFYCGSATGGGLTPLLDQTGRPILSPVREEVSD